MRPIVYTDEPLGPDRQSNRRPLPLVDHRWIQGPEYRLGDCLPLKLELSQDVRSFEAVKKSNLKSSVLGCALVNGAADARVEVVPNTAARRKSQETGFGK